MPFINDFLRSQPDGGEALYALTGTVAAIAMAAFVLFYFIRMKVRPLDALKGVAIGIVGYGFTVFAQHFVVWYRVGFALDRYFQTANLALGFTLLPVAAWLSAKIFNASYGFAGDVTVLAIAGYHVIGRSGCIFSGCCYGFPCDWGMYSFRTGQNQFPVCLVESLFTLAILMFIMARICRRGYTPDGKCLPYFLLLYGVCRFFSEMTRESTREQWLCWRLSDIHFHMLAMAAVGGFLLWHITKREQSVAIE